MRLTKKRTEKNQKWAVTEVKSEWAILGSEFQSGKFQKEYEIRAKCKIRKKKFSLGDQCKSIWFDLSIWPLIFQRFLSLFYNRFSYKTVLMVAAPMQRLVNGFALNDPQFYGKRNWIINERWSYSSRTLTFECVKRCYCEEGLDELLSCC